MCAAIVILFAFILNLDDYQERAYNLSADVI